MTTQLKAALLSGLVFPGLGQISLRRYRRGITLMVLVMAGLVYIIARAVPIAISLLNHLEMEGGVTDTATIVRLATRSTTSSDTLSYIALSLIVCCWLFAIIDAYWIGKGTPGQAE